jgi:hypothetical protein
MVQDSHKYDRQSKEQQRHPEKSISLGIVKISDGLDRMLTIYAHFKERRCLSSCNKTFMASMRLVGQPYLHWNSQELKRHMSVKSSIFFGMKRVPGGTRPALQLHDSASKVHDERSKRDGSRELGSLHVNDPSWSEYVPMYDNILTHLR